MALKITIEGVTVIDFKDDEQVRSEDSELGVDYLNGRMVFQYWHGEGNCRKDIHVDCGELRRVIEALTGE